MIELEPIVSHPVEEFLLSRLAFSPDGDEIALGHRAFRTYRCDDAAPLANFDFPGFLARLRYSPDGRFVAAANLADNHPATSGHVALFERHSGAVAFQAGAPLPIETFAFGAGDFYWQEPQPATDHAPDSRLRGRALAGGDELPAVALVDLQVRAVARTPTGFVCFGRDAQGERRTIDSADLIFRRFRLRTLDHSGTVVRDHDLGIGAGVHALSPDGRLLVAEMVDFKNNERHVSLFDVETGVEANLLALEANTLPVLEFGAGSEYLVCMKEDPEADYNVVRLWRTSDLKLLGEARVALGYHTLAACLEHGRLAFLGAGKLDIFALK